MSVVPSGCGYVGRSLAAEVAQRLEERSLPPGSSIGNRINCKKKKQTIICNEVKAKGKEGRN